MLMLNLIASYLENIVILTHRVNRQKTSIRTFHNLPKMNFFLFCKRKPIEKNKKGNVHVTNKYSSLSWFGPAHDQPPEH